MSRYLEYLMISIDARATVFHVLIMALTTLIPPLLIAYRWAD